MQAVLLIIELALLPGSDNSLEFYLKASQFRVSDLQKHQQHFQCLPNETPHQESSHWYFEASLLLSHQIKDWQG